MDEDCVEELPADNTRRCRFGASTSYRRIEAQSWRLGARDRRRTEDDERQHVDVCTPQPRTAICFVEQVAAARLERQVGQTALGLCNRALMWSRVSRSVVNSVCWFVSKWRHKAEAAGCRLQAAEPSSVKREAH